MKFTSRTCSVTKNDPPKMEGAVVASTTVMAGSDALVTGGGVVKSAVNDVQRPS